MPFGRPLVQTPPLYSPVEDLPFEGRLDPGTLRRRPRRRDLAAFELEPIQPDPDDEGFDLADFAPGLGFQTGPPTVVGGGITSPDVGADVSALPRSQSVVGGGTAVGEPTGTGPTSLLQALRIARQALQLARAAERASGEPNDEVLDVEEAPLEEQAPVGEDQAPAPGLADVTPDLRMPPAFIGGPGAQDVIADQFGFDREPSLDLGATTLDVSGLGEPRLQTTGAFEGTPGGARMIAEQFGFTPEPEFSLTDMEGAGPEFEAPDAEEVGGGFGLGDAARVGGGALGIAQGLHTLSDAETLSQQIRGGAQTAQGAVNVAGGLGYEIPYAGPVLAVAGAVPGAIDIIGSDQLSNEQKAALAFNQASQAALAFTPFGYLAPVLDLLQRGIMDITGLMDPSNYERHRTEAARAIQGTVPTLYEDVIMAGSQDEIRAALERAQARLRPANSDLTITPDLVGSTLTGGYEIGERSFPAANQRLQEILGQQLQLIQAAGSGDAQAQAILAQRQQAAYESKKQRATTGVTNLSEGLNFSQLQHYFPDQISPQITPEQMEWIRYVGGLYGVTEPMLQEIVRDIQTQLEAYTASPEYQEHQKALMDKALMDIATGSD